ncbi:MAG: type secretion system protein [Deltaproteobacteria bacterium]|jgi:pilus assembly protein CpaF|nr:type secretion system protein [Deltaproteobacteria bacterium]
MTISHWMASKKNGSTATAPVTGNLPSTAFGEFGGRPSGVATESHTYQNLKSSIHRKLIDRMDLSSVSEISPEQLAGIIKTVVEGLITAEGIPLTRLERERLIVEIQHETLGLGPLEPLLQDPAISDIMVNGPDRVYIEKQGKLQRTEVAFKDTDHLMTIIERIVSKVGRRVDESSPLVDARLPDGSRVNVIIPPLALDGPSMSIRRFGVDPLRMENLIANKSLTEEMAKTFDAMVRARLNILVSGGTGAGKTTLLNILSASVPYDERIVTIEDSAELILQQDHVVRLETRPPNIEGKGMVTQRDLVRNALRMRPDRIIVGEVRGAEAMDMLQAMNTGHDGSISTVHANSPRDALSRLETMVLMAGFELPVKAIREQVSSALNAIIQVARMSDGTRKIVKVTEVTGMEGEVVVMQDIFVFEKQGLDPEGKVVGQYRATGVRPKFLDTVHTAGIHLGSELFANRKS